MLINLLLGLPVMAGCLLLQTLLVIVALRYYRRRAERVHGASLWTAARVTAGVMLILIGGNLLQIIAWAALFRILGEFPALDIAIYHSAVNFATLGYGDIVMSERHALLGPLEAINGAIMIGVSTAALNVAFRDALESHAG